MWPLQYTPLLVPFFLFHFPAALVALPAQPKTTELQPFVLPTSTPPSTIPAFPEQSDVTGSCPLNLPQELFRGVSRACPSSSTSPSRSRCCPALAAWLYAAYSATALAAAARVPPPYTAASSHPPSDMPLLPDDSETCVDGVEKALRSRGLALAPVNDTCDVAYCYCGVRLRPFNCPGALALERDAAGRWIASGDAARLIERDCALPGTAGCSRCLRSLYQLKPAAHGGDGNTNSSGRGAKLGRDHDCQLLGLTWLLARNRTLYLPAATRVLRAFTLTPPGGPRPLSCTNGMPLPVDSADFDDSTSSSASTSPPSHLAALSTLLLLCLWWPLQGLQCRLWAGRDT